MANPAEMAAKRLAWEMESWTSIEIRTREDSVESFSTKHPIHFYNERHYIETAAGQRMSEMRLGDAKGVERLQVNFTDGQRAADVLQTDTGGWDHQQVSIKRAFGSEGSSGWADRPEPLLAFYVGIVPLPKALATAEYLGEARLLGRDCDVFLFPHIQGTRTPLDVVHVLDRATSIPLKMTVYPNAKFRAEDRPESIWTAESFDEVEGHHLALRSSSLKPSFDPSRKVDVESHIEVKEIHYNREFPTSTFWPTTGRDGVVYDEITGKRTGPDPRTIVKKKTGAAPLRAEAGGGWAAAIPSVSLGLGVAVLVAGLLLWWRRR